MNRIKYIIPVVLLGLLLSSCSTTTHTTRSSAFYPDRVELRINIKDLELLGQTEITSSCFKYLGFINYINEINGVKFDPVNKNIAKIEGVWLGVGNNLEYATYKVIEEFPDADYFHTVYITSYVEKLVLGKEIKTTAVIRAYGVKKQ